MTFTRDDIKFLLSGIIGALLIAAVAFAAYQGFQRARDNAPVAPGLETPQARQALIDSQTAKSEESTLAPEVQEQIIQSQTATGVSGGDTSGSSAGTSAGGGLSPEERQKMIDAMSAH